MLGVFLNDSARIEMSNRSCKTQYLLFILNAKYFSLFLGKTSLNYMHGLRAPNEGLNQTNLKCLGRTWQTKKAAQIWIIRIIRQHSQHTLVIVPLSFVYINI